MPSPTTALEVIEDALGLTNAVGVDQTLTADEVSDCLRTFNDLIEDWNTQGLAIYASNNQTFNTVANQAVYTIGTGGDWNTTRPITIDAPGYSVINGVTFPCVPMTQAQYNMIAVKDQGQQFPDRYLYLNTFPLGTVTLWPVPNAVTPITFTINNALTAISSAGASISFPPGYAKAFRYALAIEFAPMFGKDLARYPGVVKIARDSFANIKGANKQLKVMQFDQAYLQSRYTIADFYRGY